MHRDRPTEDVGQEPEGDRSLRAVVRREYFARAGVAAARYELDPDPVVRFCLERRPRSPLHMARLIAHLEDVAHAVACIEGTSQAWIDLRDLHEAALVRAAAERIDESSAILLVRRWFRELERTSRAPALQAASPATVPAAPPATPAPRKGPAFSLPAPTLRSYSGLKPLRHWLGERILVETVLHAARAPRPVLRLTGSDCGIVFPSSAGR